MLKKETPKLKLYQASKDTCSPGVLDVFDWKAMRIHLKAQAEGYSNENANGCLGEQKLQHATTATLELYLDGCRKSLHCCTNSRNLKVVVKDPGEANHLKLIFRY